MYVGGQAGNVSKVLPQHRKWKRKRGKRPFVARLRARTWEAWGQPLESVPSSQKKLVNKMFHVPCNMFPSKILVRRI